MPVPEAPRAPVQKRPSNAPMAIVGVGLFALGLLAVGSAGVVAAPYLAGAAFLIYQAVHRTFFAAPSQALAGSFQAIALGRLAEAERFLDEAESHDFAWVRRLTDVQRAIIALRRGDPRAACDRLDAALRRPLGFVARDHALHQIESALALRAFARASAGALEGARRDILDVRARPGTTAESLARASLAEAVILEKSGGKDALRALLNRDKGLLLESCHPRERALVRAYQRMVRVATTTAYRVSAERDEESYAALEEPPLAAWIAKVAPSALPFVRVPRSAAETAGPPIPALPESRADAHAAVLAARDGGAGAGTQRARRTRAIAALSVGAALLLGVTAVVLFATLGWPELPRDGLPPPLTLYSQFTGILAVCSVGAAGFALLGARLFGRLERPARGDLRRLAIARAALGRGDTAAAVAAAGGLTEREHALVAAHAHAVVAAAADRRGDGPALLAASTAGLTRLNRTRSREADALRPELIAQRALALTILDRRDEATSELLLLRQTGSPTRERDLFRVRLVDLARQGRLAEAARWVEQGALDLPLGVREELLADLLRAIAAPDAAGLGELARLNDELRDEPEHRAWIEAVAPQVLPAFHAATEGAPEEPRLRIAETAGAPSAAILEAESEAEAEAERAPALTAARAVQA